MIFDTIAAISTPRGKGGVALIRISGGDAAAILSRVFVPKGKTAPAQAPRRAIFGSVVSGGEVVDEGVAVFFASPASYTGEDVAEISCHGGVAVTARVLETVFAAGACPAEAGEFTRRAFINGKLTLSEAEAIGLLIDADTDDRARLAATAATGALSGEIREIADNVTASLSALYAAIDYPDEDIGEIEPEALADEFDVCVRRLERLGATYKRGSAIVDGVPTAIVGAVNAGKSSLYNAICGRDAAIVTDVEGTTRDVLTQSVSFGGVTLLLHDTAGIREAVDTVEKIGVERAKITADESSLVFFVYDLSRPLKPAEREFAESFVNSHPNVASVAIFAKCDLERKISREEEKDIGSIHTAAVTLSAKTGEGIDLLAETVGRLYDAAAVKPGDAVIWSAAQMASVSRARELLIGSAAALRAGEPTDAACTMAEGAIESLMQIDGRGVSEEVVKSIFARFCVGK